MTDVAMRFYISHSPPPLRSFISSYGDLQRAKSRANQPSARSRGQQQQRRLYKPLRPCLSSPHRAAEVGWSKKRAAKKRVVFADTKGLALTSVHVFSKFDDEPYASKPTANGIAEELQFEMTDLESAAMDLKISSPPSLALDFKQPSADYLDFRNRLIRNCVSLENCSLQERSLTGTVKVRNLGYEKSVQVRVTYDSWATFADVDCTFLNNVYGCQDTDTFAFELDLPSPTPPPQNRIEFCICFKAQGQTYWDNNEGKNYPLRRVGWNGEDVHKSSAVAAAAVQEQPKTKMELDQFDQFGSPRMSSGLFPGWQSCGQIDGTVPYW